MFSFFRRRHPPVTPADPQAWQRHWHQVLDDYPDPEGSERGVPDPLPDMDHDIRLEFTFWYVEAEARRRAYEILPRGTEILARVESHLATKRSAIEPEAALALLRRGLELIEPLCLDAPKPEADVRIVAEDDEPELNSFSAGDNPFYGLWLEMPDMARRETGDAGWEAYFFLKTPLYRLAHSYQVLEWVEWPLCAGPNEPDLTEASYRLFMGGWTPTWATTGLFLFDRRHEFGLV